MATQQRVDLENEGEDDIDHNNIVDDEDDAETLDNDSESDINFDDIDNEEPNDRELMNVVNHVEVHVENVRENMMNNDNESLGSLEFDDEQHLIQVE